MSTRKHTIARRPFTVEEDARLIDIMNKGDFINWEIVAQQMGDRSSRQCRERWVNYLSPGIRTDPWTDYEDRLLVQKINELGRCWSTIGQFFNGRSENDVKNRWYSHLKYISIERGGCIQLVSDPSLCPFPERKKRKRTKICPQQNALRVLEQQKQKEELKNAQMTNTSNSDSTKASEQNNNDSYVSIFNDDQNTTTANAQEEKPEIYDFWDPKFFDDYADANFERDLMQLDPSSFPFAMPY